jgi:Ca2+-binding RTX toxin-like protein
MFSITDTTFNPSEGNSGSKSFTFTVTRTSSVGVASVDYATVGGTATAGSDFQSDSGTLTFADGEVSKIITVVINGDTTYESDESFSVVLSNPIGDTFPNGADTLTATSVIRNDDAALPTVSILPTSITQLEGSSGTTAYTFTVALSTSTSQPITVNYSTNDGTATLLNADYQDNDGTLTFLPGGPLEQTITVLVNGDTQLEPTEFFTVNLDSATNADINPNASVATGTITNDELVYTFTASDASIVPEGNSSSTLQTFVISRTGATTQASTLSFNLAGSATLGTDYTLAGVTGTGISVSGNTIQFAAGATTAVITLAIQGDTQIETDETILLSLTDPASLATIVGSPISTMIVNDDDVVIPTLPIVSVSASDASAAEAGSDPGSFRISRDGGDTNTPLTVSYTIGGTATNGIDYTPTLTGTVIIPAGQLFVDIPIPVVDDLAVDPNESVILTLTDSTTYDLGTTAATVTIADNDFLPPPASPVVSITASDPNAAEAGNDPGTFTISRSGDTSAALTVNYTISGTATSGTDYTSLVQTATIPAGQESVEVTVLPIDDSEEEGTETVSLTLIDSSVYDLNVAAATATVTIADNDALPPPPLPTVSITATDPAAAEAGNDAGTFTISRTGNTSEALTVTYTVGGTATSGTDYATLEQTVTIPAGQESIEVTVLPADDADIEGSETVSITLIDSNGYDLNVAAAGATVTIADNDVLPTVSIDDVSFSEGNSGTTTVTFTVNLSAPSSTPVTVQYATADNTALAGSDYTTASGLLTFNSGETSQTITVDVQADLNVEGNETFFVNLSNLTGAIFVDAQGLGTILNDDVDIPPPSPTLSINDAALSEGDSGSTLTFTVNLSAPSSTPVTVEYATADGSAIAPGDYTASPLTTLTFAPGQTSQTITVNVQDDLAVEGDETLFVNLSNATGATITDAQGIGTILNDDVDVPPPLPTLSIDNVNLSEGDSGTTTFTFTVSLSAASSTPIAVEYATADGSATALSDYTAIPLTTLTFAPGQTSQSITVNVQGDLDVEMSESFVVNLSNATGATITVTQGTGTILNDDVPIVVNAPPLAIADQGSVTEGQAVTIAVLDNDSDPEGDPLVIDSFTNPQFGTVIRNNDGTFSYQANLDFAGADSFTYQISDGQGGVSSAIVSITVNPLNLIGTDCCDHLVGTNTGNRIEGRGGHDWIEGRGGNDWLNGESGWDTLIGGTGADRFVFASNSAFTPCSLGVDTIVDFDRSQGDAIVLSKTTFTALSSLVGDSLNADDFAVINSACNGATLAAASVARIVFNQATGDLFYNQNGSCCGFGSGGQFATLSVNSSTTPLQTSDFRVIA